MRGIYIFCLLIFISCSNTLEEIESTYTDSMIFNIGQNVEINYISDFLKFKVIAREMKTPIGVIKNKKIQFPKGINVYVYNKQSDTVATIIADEATECKTSKIIELKKNVLLRNFKDEQLNTEKLFWNQETKNIYTDEFVTINTENQIVMGFGFSSDENFKNYKLSNITGTIYP